MERSLDHDPSRTVRPDAPAEQSSGAGNPAGQGCRVGEHASIAAAGSAGDPHVTYVPCPDATPEAELAALAAVYRYLLDRREENVLGAGEGTGNSQGQTRGSTVQATTGQERKQ